LLAAAIDFGILNLLMFMTGLVSGLPFTLFKTLSFIAAATNSYFVNKYWTFRKIPDLGFTAASGQRTSLKEYAQFLVVSVIGITINVGIASFVVSAIGPQFGLDLKLWANLGAVAGSAIGLIWNFIGFKLIVFRA
ncbi:MAG: GtrA family protein, partial [Patescibacteria group bacterium]